MASSPASGDLERRYDILLDILEILAGERSQEELLSAVIRLAGTAVGADRGFILLYDAEGGRWLPDSVASWHSPDEPALAFDGDLLAQVSQTVLSEALAGGRTVFLKFAATDPRYQAAASIHLQAVQSLICCPLLVGERRVGAFYVDRKHEGGRPFSDADGELLAVIAHQAGRVLEKEQLLREKSRAEKLAMLGTMVGRITHELKNPLYNIRGTTENLIDKIAAAPLSPDELRQRLERILAGCEKAEGRMRSLLRFARPAARARERVSLSRVLTAAAAETAEQLAAAKISLERHYGKGIYVLADPDSLEQVFVNLIVNAAQALDERGGGRICIESSLEQRLNESGPDWVEVRVSDDGPGIPPANLARIFEDFFTTRTGSGGSGLGLALCRHLIEEQRGRLSAENRPEGGALFRVGLPLLVWDGEAAPAESSQP